MNIAILTPTFFKYSGPDRVVENEAAEHVEKGHKVTVFTFRGDIKPEGYKVRVLGMPRNRTLERLYRLFFFADILKVMRVAKELQEYDEIISFMYPMTIIATTASKYYKKKYVYYNVGVAYPRLFGSFFERIYMRLFNFFTNFTVKNADSAISISDFLRKELKRETGLDSEVRHVAVDSRQYKNIDKGKIAAVIEKHHLQHPILLYVGRLSPHKSVHLLLDVFREVKLQVPTATLVIVGKETFGAYAKKLREKRGEGVVFTGFVPDEELPYYFGACDLYTTATLWEGFDIPAVQAQLAGKDVVAFKVGSHPEVVNNGILVKPGSIKEFAGAVLKLLKR